MVSVVSSVIGNQISPQANIIGTITAPFRSAANSIWNGLEDFVSAYRDGNELMLENAELEAELNDLREQLAEYEQALAENEFYKKYLKIAEENPDFKFSAAKIIFGFIIATAINATLPLTNSLRFMKDPPLRRFYFNQKLLTIIFVPSGKFL